MGTRPLSCNICISECPVKAIQLLYYEDVQVGAEIGMLLILETMCRIREHYV